MRPNKETERLHGELIKDLANSKNSDEALYGLFRNIQKVFSFSEDFAVELRNSFPSPYNPPFTLSDEEKKLFDLLMEEAQLLYSVKKSQSYWNLHSYKWKKRILVFEEALADEEGLTGEYSYQERKLSEDLVHLWAQEAGLTDKLERLMQVGKELERIKKKGLVSKERSDAFKGYMDLYPSLMDAHENMGATREEMKSLLYWLSKGRNLRESKIFRRWLKAYNTEIQANLRMSDDGTIFENRPFSEEDFEYFAGKSPNGYALTKLCEKVITFCLVEFLRNPENHKLIGRCEECEKFFIKHRIDSKQKQRFCSDKCRLALHNREDIASGKRAAQKRERFGWKPKSQGKREMKDKRV